MTVVLGKYHKTVYQYINNKKKQRKENNQYIRVQLRKPHCDVVGY